MALTTMERRILRQIERELSRDGWRLEPWAGGRPVIATGLVVALAAVSIVACGVHSAAVLAPVLWATGCMALLLASCVNAVVTIRSHWA